MCINWSQNEKEYDLVPPNKNPAKGYELWRYGGKKWKQKAGLISLESGETMTIVCPLKRKPK